MSVGDLGGRFALDLQGLHRLKQTAHTDSPAALKGASQQFEALLLQMMLKSMREASPESGLFDSQQTRLYTELLDQQWAQHLSGRGLGLAEQLVKQLEMGDLATPRESAGRAVAAEELIAGIPRATPRPLYGSRPVEPNDYSGASAATPLQDNPVPRRVPSAAAGSDSVAATRRPEHVSAFLARLEAPARAASRASGVPAELILAQAALETGWGRYSIPTDNGGDSHNLFGIKAGSQWRGATTDVTTSEYVGGQERKLVERFRVYGSYTESFTDYARLIGNNPRYAGVVAAPDAVQAAHALQRAGYATDPAYADKLVAVMNSIGPLADEKSLADGKVRESRLLARNER